MAATRTGFVPPMMAMLYDEPPAGDRWLYEVKLDGIRAVAVRNGDSVKLYSRKPRDITSEFPKIAAAIKKLAPSDLVVDGEIVALDEDGRSSFQLLQNLRQKARAGAPVMFVLFDVVRLEGADVTNQPLERRRALLRKILPRDGMPLRLSPLLEADPDVIWTEVQRLGLEGIIAKDKTSRYEPGKRSRAWRKIKSLQEQEFVIGGYTEPRGTRKLFGAILVGYYEGRQLHFASAVGTGFTDASLRSLHRRFQKYRTAHCPFTNLPDQRRLTAADMRRCTWLKPALLSLVKFYEWTADGNLRHPVFLGLRDDKKASLVVRERARSGS